MRCWRHALRYDGALQFRRVLLATCRINTGTSIVRGRVTLQTFTSPLRNA